jgi:hypothetical protein
MFLIATSSLAKSGGHIIYVVHLFLLLGILWIAAPLFPAENLLIVDVYAWIVPEGQIELIPILDPRPLGGLQKATIYR